MAERINHDDLMRYIDGELSPEAHARVEIEIAASSELTREVAIFRAMKGGFQELSFHPGTHRTSVWSAVNERLTRPIGWLLLVTGAAVWIAYGVYVFATSAVSPWQKLAAGAVVVGIILLLAGVIHERYREWLTDPYRHIQR